MRLNCPDCGARFELGQAVEDGDGRRFVELLTSLPPIVIKPLMHYLRLFKPPERGLRWSRMLKLTQELAPMIKAAQVARNRTVYVVTAQQWADAMTRLADSPSPDLRLPLKSNGYLLGMLANVGEQQAAQAEQREIEQARQRSRAGSTGGAVSVADLVTETRTPAAAKKHRSTPPKGWKGPLDKKGTSHE
ncbi:MAG TPA: hypothetical protein ENJ17_01155 [Gammaproteobacteria bacterium]|nr:hypothetical protein [Gammaproteobacteria bacterium]